MKLFRFVHSCYARKIEAFLDLGGATFEVVDVPYGDRSALVAVTGGYVQVPVLVLDDSRVVVDSRQIAETLVREDDRFAAMVPSPLEGPIWAYSDWVDTTLEDVMFRLASPAARARLPTPNERALYTFVKERKFGTGCVDEWMMSAASLAKKASSLLAPTARTLAASRFIFGDRPTLADAALFGQVAMLASVDLKLLTCLQPEILAWFKRVREAGARDPTEAPATIRPGPRSVRNPQA
jgi:glutathione S-transferase